MFNLIDVLCKSQSFFCRASTHSSNEMFRFDFNAFCNEIILIARWTFHSIKSKAIIHCSGVVCIRKKLKNIDYFQDELYAKETCSSHAKPILTLVPNTLVIIRTSSDSMPRSLPFGFLLANSSRSSQLTEFESFNLVS